LSCDERRSTEWIDLRRLAGRLFVAVGRKIGKRRLPPCGGGKQLLAARRSQRAQVNVAALT
jgi:hypothetical protein